MSEAYIGVDVGTLSARAGVFDRAGQLIASARRPIAIWREPGEIVEQSSDDIWRAATSAVRRSGRGVGSAARGDCRHRLRRHLLAGRRSTATARPLSVGPTGDAERDVIVWMDHRAVDEAERINARRHTRRCAMSAARSRRRCRRRSLRGSPGTSRETSPSAGHFFDLTDFLTFRATGSLARSTCTVDLQVRPISRMSGAGRTSSSTASASAFSGTTTYARIGAAIRARRVRRSGKD